MNFPKIRKIGALSVITTLLVFSAGIRLVGVSSAAFALGEQNSASAVSTETHDDSPKSASLDVLLASFQTREKKLTEDEAQMSVRAKVLEKTEADIAEKLNELGSAEMRLRKLLAIADSAAEDDVARLTSVYENMKPKLAAIVFEEMEPAFAAGFFARMRPASAAAVMAGLTPKTAYAVSVVLAGRHSESEAN